MRTVCPLDCPDSCSLLVEVSAGRAVKLGGDPGHPVTRGFICGKGQKHLRRLYDPYRLQTPLLRRGDDWQPVSWDTAYQVMARRLSDIAARDGSRAILSP